MAEVKPRYSIHQKLVSEEHDIEVVSIFQELTNIAPTFVYKVRDLDEFYVFLIEEGDLIDDNKET